MTAVSTKYSIGERVLFLDAGGKDHVGMIQRIKVIVEPDPAAVKITTLNTRIFYTIVDTSGHFSHAGPKMWKDVPQEKIVRQASRFDDGGSGKSGGGWSQAKQQEYNQKYGSMFGDDDPFSGRSGRGGKSHFDSFNFREEGQDAFRDFFSRMANDFRDQEARQKDEDDAFRKKYADARSKGGKDSASEQARRKAEEANRQKKWQDDFFARMRGASTQDHYAVLGIERGATKEQIKKAWRKKVMEWHPDRNQHRQKEAEEMTVKINRAYEALQ